MQIGSIKQIESLSQISFNLFITEHNHRQLVSSFTMDNQTTIDHIYTNLPQPQARLHLLETNFSDHK